MTSTGPRSEVLAGRRPVLESLRAGHPAERVLIARESGSPRLVAEIRRRAGELSVPVRVVPREVLDDLASGLNHQGVVAVTGPFRYAPLERILDQPNPAVLFADGIMDPHNLGSLLRSAAGAGFAGLVVRARRAAGVTASARRVSAGAAETMPVARVGSLGLALDQARRAGLWIVGLDPDAARDLWSSALMEAPVGLVLGAEDRGLSPATRRHCDELVSIPTGGALGSLNVASAGAVAMFEVARRRQGSRAAPPPGAKAAGSTLNPALE
jgi:23S rRNA (guanosine2251-2'-O)-methyltransferase